jgi:hypothetical protein
MTTKFKDNNDCTIFLKSKNSDIVIFNYNYEKLKSWRSYNLTERLDLNTANDYLLHYENIVNLTEKDTIEFENNTLILIECSSQHILALLLYFFPQKEFVLAYCWYQPCGDYDDYIDVLWDSSNDETSKFANKEGKIEVVQQLLNVYITDKNDSDDPWLEDRIEIFDFPTCNSSMKLASEYGCAPAFEYDDLRIFEKEEFYNLEVKKVDRNVEYEGKSFPIAPMLNLEVEKYKTRIKLNK